LTDHRNENLLHPMLWLRVENPSNVSEDSGGKRGGGGEKGHFIAPKNVKNPRVISTPWPEKKTRREERKKGKKREGEGRKTG